MKKTAILISTVLVVALGNVALVHAQATLNAPAEAVAGSRIDITWTGPGNGRDYITIVKADAPERTYEQYQYIDRGNPINLPVPEETGRYEIRYCDAESYATLGRRVLTVTAATATLEAPPNVPAGADFEVTWRGPDNERDFITIVEAGAPERTYKTYQYTTRGNPVTLTAPDEAGAYEIRYLTGGKYYTLAARAITVGGTDATVQAPEQVTTRDVFEVTWRGPDNQFDYIGVFAEGATSNVQGSYAYTRRGNPVQIKAPEEPGVYEVRYVTGQAAKTLAAVPLIVVPGDQPGTVLVRGSAGGEGDLRGGTAVELILDASGSMLQRQDGQRRITTAKQALLDLTQNVLPENTPFALRVFGHREAGSCRTDLEIPLQPLNAADAAAAIGSVEAMNLAKTPIARSLELVKEDVQGLEGQLIVILVTDGEETCGGDPKQAIESLRQAGIEVRVNIVGFAIDEFMLKETFREWARAGGGRYFDAQGADDLSQGITESLHVPFELVNAQGVVVGAGAVGGVAVEAPPGTYAVKVLSSPARTVSEVVVTSGEETLVRLD